MFQYIFLLLYYYKCVTVNVFPFKYVTIFAFISITIIVRVNGMDVFPLTDISVTIIVNGKNTAVYDSSVNLLLISNNVYRIRIHNKATIIFNS